MDFHSLTEKSMNDMPKFQPFCFAGLNGTGKSNVLESLAAIFYHLELCVAKFRPVNFDKHFRKDKCTPDAFYLVYLICREDQKKYSPETSFIVYIKKEIGEEPKMFVDASPISRMIAPELREISLVTSKSQDAAEGKKYLPKIVVGYSSGENEILSLPFLKNRLIHFDEYKEALLKNLEYKEPETSLIYIDSEMSQAVLLSILLFESKETLKPLEKELHIKGLRSFRMNLNLHKIHHDIDQKVSSPILTQLEPQIQKLKKCATSWFADDKVMWLDFFVDEQTKKVFQDNFKNSFALFRFFQILYELNSRIVKDSIKEEVYSSKGYYTDGKLPTGSPEQNVFYFLDYLILKHVEGEPKPIELLLRNFSDGEHQFLHTMGICLMLKDRSSLLLLDEPETHFNPGWRAKFIKVLNDSIKAGGGNNMMKEILLSSHSPFIISDCMPNNVIVFEKDETTGQILAKTANELNIRTFGTSIEEISDKIFKYDQSIGELSNFELEKIDFDTIKTEVDVINAKKSIQHLGDSIEKDLILARLNQLLPKTNM
jgi:restriction system-associated AAA family ATPase